MPPPGAVPPIPPRRKNPAYVAQGKRIAAMSPAHRKGTTIGPDGVERHGNGKIVNPDGNGHTNLKNWNPRHQLILWMDIAGRRGVDIAQELGMLPPSVSAIRNSPLYQAQKDALIEKLTGSTLEDIMEMIRRDAPKNLQVLIDLRDRIELHGGDPKVILGAAKQMSHESDRVWPRKTHHVEDRTIRISIEAAQLNRLAGALREIGHAIPAELVEATEDVTDAPFAAQSIDELLTQCRADDAARNADESR